MREEEEYLRQLRNKRKKKEKNALLILLLFLYDIFDSLIHFMFNLRSNGCVCYE